MTVGCGEYHEIVLEVEVPVARVTMSRPDRYNALGLAMMEELIAALGEVAASAAQVVVLSGSGKGFCAGHDLAELARADGATIRRTFAVCTELMESVHRVPQPVIAKVHGVATAAGCQLVASCDLVVAADDARFATPGVRIDLFCSTPMVPVSRAVGRKRALEMLLTGDFVSAATAAEWGLVNRVVPADRLDAAVDEFASKIAAASPLTVAIGKEAFYAQVNLDEHRAYEHTKTVMELNMTTADAQEGVEAFLDKRPPKWVGA